MGRDRRDDEGGNWINSMMEEGKLTRKTTTTMMVTDEMIHNDLLVRRLSV